MSSLNDFLRKINNITRGVNNITRTVSNVRTTVRSAKRLRDELLKKKNSSTQLPGSVSQPQQKPLGLTPVSRSTTGRNTNKRPVRPPPRSPSRIPPNNP